MEQEKLDQLERKVAEMNQTVSALLAQYGALEKVVSELGVALKATMEFQIDELEEKNKRLQDQIQFKPNFV